MLRRYAAPLALAAAVAAGFTAKESIESAWGTEAFISQAQDIADCAAVLPDKARTEKALTVPEGCDAYGSDVFDGSVVTDRWVPPNQNWQYLQTSTEFTQEQTANTADKRHDRQEAINLFAGLVAAAGFAMVYDQARNNLEIHLEVMPS